MPTFVVTFGAHSNTIEISDDGVIRVNGETLEADIRRVGSHRFSVLVGGWSTSVSVLQNGASYHAYHNGVQHVVTVESERARLLGALVNPERGRHAKLEITAPMPALVVRVEVKPGDRVQEGQGVVVLEAMKMENEIKAHHSGIVKEVYVQAGKPVEKGELLMLLEEE